MNSLRQKLTESIITTSVAHVVERLAPPTFLIITVLIVGAMRWWRKWKIIRVGAICVLAISFVGSASWAVINSDMMTEMKGLLKADGPVRRCAWVLAFPAQSSNSLVEAEGAITDDSGAFSMHLAPNTYRYLVLKNCGELLFLSVLVRKKDWMPTTEEFDLNARSVPYVGVTAAHFLFKSDALPNDGQKMIRDLFLQHPKSREQWWVIVGHTDHHGPPECNKILGMDRARTTAKYLKSLGIPWDHIIISSLGFKCPNNEGSGADELNRRVDVLLTPSPYVPPREPVKGKSKHARAR